MTELSLRGDLKWGTIGRLAADAAVRYPDRPAIVDGVVLSFADLHRQARAFARALLTRGVEVGDRIAVWAPNRWEFVAAALGAQSAGASLVPINTRYKGREAANILGRSKPRLLVMVADFLGTDYPVSLVEAGWDAGDAGCEVLLLDPTEPLERPGWEAFLREGEGVEEAELDRRIDGLSGEEISDILFTSGTAGDPKGVMTTHAQNLRAYYDWSTIAGFRSGDRYAVINPFFHAFGYKVGWLSALMHGMTVYPHAVLDVPALLRQVERERIEVLPGPPAIYQSIFEELGRCSYDVSSLRLAVTGAASIAPALIERMRREIGFQRITTCYGLTEGTGIASITRASDDDVSVATTTGGPLPDVELKIVSDESPVPLGPGEAGEILIRGYNVAQGYLDTPAQNEAAVDREGWLHSGDIGTLDDDGRLAITDRKDDMFTVGGFNVYPAEVEAVMQRHPDVAQVAVVAAPDGRLGSLGVAYVVPRDGSELEGEELIEWCRAELANFKVPRQIRFVTDLPRNATGKVLKRVLREASKAGDGASPGAAF